MTGPLIESHELAERIDDDRLRICDTRWYLGEPRRGVDEYETAHIPGAVFVDLDHDLAGLDGGGRHPLPSVSQFATSLGRIGIDNTTSVVAYDDSGGAIAARLWWMLKAVDHDDVQILDGGWGAWVRDRFPITATRPTIDATQFTAPHDWSGIIDRDGVRTAAPNRAIVDARAPERFRGDSEPIDARPGHIPGAMNIPHTDTLDTQGRHLPVERLVELFAGVGPNPILYCGSGVTACHDLLAMTVAGRTDGVLYPGSWSDWAAHVELPAELGE